MADKSAYELEREERIKANRLKIQVCIDCVSSTTCVDRRNLSSLYRNSVWMKQQPSLKRSDQARSSV